MTDTPRPIDPEHVDELLSADLDGELDAAARDLGYEPAAVRAALVAEPELRARRDTLARAQTELARPTPLDEVSAARLRAAALAATEAHRPRRTRMLATAGAAAAVIAIIAAVVGVTHSTHDSAKTEASGGNATPRPVASSAGATRAAATGVDFGTVADVDALATRAAALTSTDAKDAAPLSGSAVSTQSGLASAGTIHAPPAVSERPPGCELAARRLAGAPSTLIVSGTATVAGRAVSVSVFARPGKANVIVVFDTECKLVGTRSLATPSP